MNQVIAPGDLEKPRIVTFKQLCDRLAPFLAASPREAMLELHDLWIMGAPTPDSGPHTEERRILFPNQFSRWWRDMAQRRGWELTPRQVYRGPSD